MQYCNSSRTNLYSDLVKDDSGRQLMYDIDVLAAFTGVIKVLEEREQTEILWALRERWFIHDLIWEGGDSKRFPVRHAECPNDSKLYSHGIFPTWSWLVWKGSIEIMDRPPVLSLEGYEGHHLGSFLCFTVDESPRGTDLLRPVRGPESPKRQGIEQTWNPRLEDQDILEHPVQRVLWDNVLYRHSPDQLRAKFHIFFWTFSVKVVLKSGFDTLTEILRVEEPDSEFGCSMDG